MDLQEWNLEAVTLPPCPQGRQRVGRIESLLRRKRVWVHAGGGGAEHSPQARWVRLALLSDRLDGKQEAPGFQQDWV